MFKKSLLVLCLIILLISTLTVPIERVIGYKMAYWLKAIFTVLFLCLTILTRNFKYKYWLLLTVFASAFAARSISDLLFLGRQKGYLYLGEDAGFLELYLFPNNICRISYGGIFGVNAAYYGKYWLTDSTMRITCKFRPMELSGLKQKIEDRVYEIKID